MIKKMKKIAITLLIILVSIGCSKRNEDKTIPINYVPTSEALLKKKIIENGDTVSYETLSTSYLDNPQPEEFLFYSIIMANKYNYPQANFDVYWHLTLLFADSINKIDKRSADLAIMYLLEACKQGHHQARDIVEEYSITSKKDSKIQLEKIFED